MLLFLLQYCGWNNRRVFWIYDPRGCGQKTLLAEYLWRTCHDVRELTAGRDCDLQYTCQVTDRVFVFDMPRDCDSVHVPYGTIEACCDGRFFHSKYQSKVVRSVRGQRFVLVLCNHEPSWDKLSRDRLHFYNCETKETLLPGESALRTREQ